MTKKEKKPIKDIPSATDDCADVRQGTKNIKKNNRNQNFPQLSTKSHLITK